MKGCGSFYVEQTETEGLNVSFKNRLLLFLGFFPLLRNIGHNDEDILRRNASGSRSFIKSGGHQEGLKYLFEEEHSLVSPW